MNIKHKLIVSIAALTIASSAYAMRPGGGPCGGPPPGPPQVQPKIEHLQEVLDLTDDQANSMKQLFEEQKAKHKNLRKQHRELREQMHEGFSKILTPTQLEDMKDMKRRGCKKNRRNHR